MYGVSWVQSLTFCDDLESRGLDYQGFTHLRPKTSICHVLGERCPYLFVFLYHLLLFVIICC